MTKFNSLSSLLWMLRQELLTSFRYYADLLHPVWFFLMVLTLFPLAISPEPEQLKLIAPGIIWIAALLSIVLSLQRLYRQEYKEGIVEQWLLSPHPLVLLVLNKIVAYWLEAAVPLLLLTPIMGLTLQLSAKVIGVLLLSLMLGTPILILVGSIGAALIVGLRNAGVLLTVLILPFYIPVLIFGASAVNMAEAGLPYVGQLAFLGALLILAISLAPLATAAALRIGAGQ